MNICVCGAQPGYWHTEDCPYPLYRGTQKQIDAWQAAREVRRLKLAETKAREDAALAAYLASLQE